MDCHPVFHVSRLRICHQPETTPDDIPGRVEPPADEFIVEDILNFKISDKPPGYQRGPALIFKVRWFGYDASHDSWAPYKALRRVEALHRFARHNRQLQQLLSSAKYAAYRQEYPSRFPTSIPE